MALFRATRSAFFAYGTWDTATLTVEVLHDGTNWFTLDTFTADGYSMKDVVANHIRASVSSAGASTDVNCDIIGADTGINATDN